AGAIYLALTTLAVKATQFLERRLSTEGTLKQKRKARLRPTLPDHEITTSAP
ncbi:ABC transporter permease, partial [Mesorhizobium sp. M4A.F.Ca.ET.029.04.2.1]